MAPTHDIIYRHKQMGPRMGTPSGVKPGDLITFCDPARGFQTRTVDTVHDSDKFVVVTPVISEDIVMWKAQRVPFGDMRKVLRPKPEKKDAGR